MRDLGHRLSEARGRRRRPLAGLFGLGGAPEGPPGHLVRRVVVGTVVGAVVTVVCRTLRGYPWSLALFMGAAVAALSITGLRTVEHLIGLHRR